MPVGPRRHKAISPNLRLGQATPTSASSAVSTSNPLAASRRCPHTAKANFILYVADQALSSAFYAAVLDRRPTLDVPGMTEFELNDGAVLGLMPEAGARKLLGRRLPDPATARGAPRAELYLTVASPAAYHERALGAGAIELSPLSARDWGDTASYCLDPDGHVIAFAERSTP